MCTWSYWWRFQIDWYLMEILVFGKSIEHFVKAAVWTLFYYQSIVFKIVMIYCNITWSCISEKYANFLYAQSDQWSMSYKSHFLPDPLPTQDIYILFFIHVLPTYPRCKEMVLRKWHLKYQNSYKDNVKITAAKMMLRIIQTEFQLTSLGLLPRTCIQFIHWALAKNLPCISIR